MALPIYYPKLSFNGLMKIHNTVTSEQTYIIITNTFMTAKACRSTSDLRLFSKFYHIIAQALFSSSFLKLIELFSLFLYHASKKCQFARETTTIAMPTGQLRPHYVPLSLLRLLFG